MQTREWRFIDKSKWPIRGPWDNEPDKAQWRDDATGLPCLAVRNHAHWCGYVGVTEGHPAFQQDWTAVDVDVHGGLTFADFCQEDTETGVCHIVEPGEPERVWWLGFDCAHSGDLTPATSPLAAAINARFPMPRGYETYKDLAYVQRQCTELAKQLARMKVEV